MNELGLYNTTQITPYNIMLGWRGVTEEQIHINNSKKIKAK